MPASLMYLNHNVHNMYSIMLFNTWSEFGLASCMLSTEIYSTSSLRAGSLFAMSLSLDILELKLA